VDGATAADARLRGWATPPGVLAAPPVPGRAGPTLPLLGGEGRALVLLGGRLDGRVASPTAAPRR
jgi:hypothetical protein